MALTDSESETKDKVITVAEVFSGSGVLSEACRKQGMENLRFDLQLSSEHDMSSESKAMKLQDQVLAANVSYCHFAPPCNTFSSACFPKLRSFGEIKNVFYLV